MLRRGLSLSCPHCNHFGWYDADDIGQDFQCQRCRTKTIIDSRVVRGDDRDPAWYYKLAEVIYQARRHNFTVPVLALNHVANNARSILGMIDHEVHFPDDTLEIDICGVTASSSWSPTSLESI